MWRKLFHILRVLLINAFFIFALVPMFAVGEYNIVTIVVLIYVVYFDIGEFYFFKELFSKKQ